MQALPFAVFLHSRYLIPMQLQGCGTALVTPFRQDGSLDEAALRNLVAWQVESGIDFLVSCGTTGETPTLSHDEWLQRHRPHHRSRRRPCAIVAGATSNSTQDAVAKAKEVAGRPGVNAILTASPYYNKPTQEGQYRHFRAIAEAVDKPIILYNVPGRTGANIEPATLARLAEVPHILGVKEASGNITQIAEVCNAVPERFLVFSGDDAITLPVIALGGVGIISVASNEIPREMADMTRAALNNDWVTARTIHRKYLALMQANFIESNPLPVKAVLAMMGKIEEVYRLPLLPMRRDTRSKLQKVATEAGLITSRRRAVGSGGLLHLRKLAGWPAQDRAAPFQLRPVQSRQRPPRRPRRQPRTLAWPLRHAFGAREASHSMASILIRSECKCI